MEQIRTLDQLVASLQGAPPRRVAVAAGHDQHTIEAAARASELGIAKMILVGQAPKIAQLCQEYSINPSLLEVIDEPDTQAAGLIAREMVTSGQAEVLMKGLLNTDQYMRLILDKEKGLLPKGAILSHVTCLEIPEFQRLHNKLLFVTDVAIIPAPELSDKIKMLGYAVKVAQAFGVEVPRVAVVTPTEKVLPKIPSCLEAAALAKMGERGQLGRCIVDGPLAFDVALSPEACQIKGLSSPVEGAADVLVFHCLEAANTFYKVCTLLAGAKLAGMVVGTSAPCILTSRADTEESKLYSIACGCRMAG